MNCKNKSFMTKKKAFTLIELLIVIAIIGILFIVLVSKVDFATDKAKATGVQTDFRSFQLAFDTVAKENAGFNTFGWDTGDANQDGIRNSYDEGDANQNGVKDTGEVWTGRKVYDETFTKVFSLKKNGTGNYNRDALNRLETAINANLDPKLHITIKDDGEIVMANGAQDPWNKEYHGWYITNAEVDNKDRGAIIMYSDGANNEFGSEHKIANGVVTVTNPGNNKFGKDDYSIVSVYTYVNGYGEVKNITTGFSNNQTFDDNVLNNNSDNLDIPEEKPEDTLVSTKYSHINGIFMIDPSIYFESDMILELAPDRETYRDLILNENYEVALTNVLVVDNGVVTMTQGWYYPATKLIIPLTDECHVETMTLDDLENSYQSAGMSINISSTSISFNMGFGVGDFNIVNNIKTIDEVQGFNIRVTDNSYWISEALAVWYDSDEYPTNNSYVMKSENTWSIYLDEDDFWEFDGMFFTNARIELDDDYFNTNWVPEGVCYPTAYSTNTQSIVFIPYF